MRHTDTMRTMFQLNTPQHVQYENVLYELVCLLYTECCGSLCSRWRAIACSSMKTVAAAVNGVRGGEFV